MKEKEFFLYIYIYFFLCNLIIIFIFLFLLLTSMVDGGDREVGQLPTVDQWERLGSLESECFECRQ